MATGYTADIKNGISFRQFALNCSKAFGALIHMRDEPGDAEIPQEITPSDYYPKQVKESETKLKWLESLSNNDIEKETLSYNEGQLKYHISMIKERAELKEKYIQMLNQVNAWEPPSKDHLKYKDFMVQQITSSIDFDCDSSHCTEPNPVSCEEWKNQQLAAAKRSLEYAKESNEKEIKNAKGKTIWI